MNSFFDVAEYFADEAKLLSRPFSVGDIKFKFLALTDDLKQRVQECDNYDDMISTAANNGLAYIEDEKAIRVVDNEHLVAKIDELWEKSELEIDSDPCVMKQAGMFVCKISGLTKFVNDKKEFEDSEAAELKALEDDERAEEARNHLAEEAEFKIGGEMVSGDTTLANLDPSQLATDALNVA